MKKIFLLIKIVSIVLTSTSIANSGQTNFLDQGIFLFEKKNFDTAKIFFEKDIVFNPRSENSYLYLAKIFKQNENDKEQETNLNNALIINPKNEEALYMLTLLKIKQSNYDKAKELINKFILVCKSFCSKKKSMQDMLTKLIPENEKNNN